MAESDAPAFDPSDVRGVLYEYGMLLKTAEMWAYTDWGTNSAAQYAIMESCLVHVRNLHDFLGPQPRKPRQGDYFASDFIHEFAVEVFGEETVNKINRWLHHLPLSGRSPPNLERDRDSAADRERHEPIHGRSQHRAGRIIDEDPQLGKGPERCSNSSAIWLGPITI